MMNHPGKLSSPRSASFRTSDKDAQFAGGPVVAGIGCRSGVTAEQIEAALEAALRQTARNGLALTLIATPAPKSGERGIIAAANARGVPLAPIAQTDLEAANPRTLTRSKHALAAMSVHSVAEAAALAGAGASSQLLGARIVVGPVTCALAARPLDTALTVRPPEAASGPSEAASAMGPSEAASAVDAAGTASAGEWSGTASAREPAGAALAVGPPGSPPEEPTP